MQLGEIIKNRTVSNVNVKQTSTNNVNNVRTIALKLSDTLHDSRSFEFFCKVAWHLPEATIWSNLEQAQRGRNPRAYFTYLCNLEMQ